MKSLSKFWKSNGKTVTIVAAVIIVVIVLYLIKKMLHKHVDKKAAEDLTGTHVTSELNWDELCDRIANACVGFGPFNTDEEAIYSALVQLRTQADWEYLKGYWIDVWEDQNLLLQANDIIWTGARKSLVGTLRMELSSSELEKCREILMGNGITADF